MAVEDYIDIDDPDLYISDYDRPEEENDMTIATGVVEAVSAKDVNITKGRMAGSVAKAYSFKLDDGNWYSNGFKAPPFAKGVSVEVVYTEGAYGREAKAVSVKEGSGAVSTEKPSTSTAGFPIPLRHKDRSIIRQNVLARAVELFLGAEGGYTLDGIVDSDMNEIISVARKLEEYCAGDIERAASEKLAGVTSKEE